MTNFITSTGSHAPDEDQLIRQRMDEEMKAEKPKAPAPVKAKKAKPVEAVSAEDLPGCWESPCAPGRVSRTLSGNHRQDN